jgi:hypothetical protein
MYKITNRQVLDANRALETMKGVKFNGKVLLKLARIGQVLQQESHNIDVARLAMLKKHGNGELVPGTEPYKTFVAEWQALLEDTVELDTKVKITEEELGLDALDGEKLSIGALRDILWLIGDQA